MCVLAENDQGGGMTEDWGGFLVLLDVFSHVGREPWCSRGACRAPFAEIFRWEITRAGTIDGLSWTDVGLHVLHARPVRIALGCCERYRPSGHGRPRVSW